MSVTSTTNAAFNGDLTDSDFNSLYNLIAIVSQVAEDLTIWYEDTVDIASTGAEWLNWLREASASNIKSQDYDERVGFTSWLNTLSFSPKYFDHNDDGIVSGIASGQKTSEVLELLSIKVDTLSTNASQVLIFTQSLIDDYSESSKEVKDLCDAMRNAGQGHIRT